jgi:hypothetical protein
MYGFGRRFLRLAQCHGGFFRGETMPRKPLKIEMRIINTDFPRFVIVDGRKRFWTGTGWSRRLREALLYAHADPLRDDIERLKRENCG